MRNLISLISLVIALSNSCVALPPVQAPDVFNITALSIQYPKLLGFLLESYEKMQSSSNGNKIIAACCKDVCGGFSDRLRGLFQTYQWAVAHNRTFEIHPQYLSTKYQKCDSQSAYFRQSEVPGAAHANSKIWYVGDNFITTIEDEGALRGGHIGAHVVGGLLMHITNSWTEEKKAQIARIRRNVDVLLPEPFIAMQVRVGGSRLKIGRSNIKGVTWNDGYSNPFSQALLEWAAKLDRRLTCSKTLTIVSDSARFITEFQLAVPQGVTVFHCCEVANHIEYSHNSVRGYHDYTDFTEQALFDLALMYKASILFHTIGMFFHSIGIFGPTPEMQWVKLLVENNNESVLLSEKTDYLLSALSCHI